MTEQPYKYGELLGQFRQIRLFQVLPSENEEDEIFLKVEWISLDVGKLSCHFTQTSSSSTSTDSLCKDKKTEKAVWDQDYNAISYTWGGSRNWIPRSRPLPPPSHKVWIGDQVLYVHEIVWQFLLHWRNVVLRSDRFNPLLTPRRLWLDSICINQGNLEERRNQSKLLANIYRSAQNVLVWLGHEHCNVSTVDQLEKFYIGGASAQDSGQHRLGSYNNFHSGRAMCDRNLPLKDYANPISSDWTRLVRNRTLPFRLSLWMLRLYRPSYWGLSLQDCVSAKQARLDIIHIAQHHFWDRLWTNVELLSARKSPILICGNSFISFFDLIEPIKASRAQAARRRTCVPGSTTKPYAQVETFIEHHNRYGRGLRLSLAELIAAYKTRNCHEIKDKIYGLVGIASDGANIEIDYECSMEQLFFRILPLYANNHQQRPVRDIFAEPYLADLLYALQLQPSHMLEYARRNRDSDRSVADALALTTNIDVQPRPGNWVVNRRYFSHVQQRKEEEEAIDSKTKCDLYLTRYRISSVSIVREEKNQIKIERQPWGSTGNPRSERVCTILETGIRKAIEPDQLFTMACKSFQIELTLEAELHLLAEMGGWLGG